MSRNRWIVATGAGLAVVVLLGWQLYRERAITRCLADSGRWNGAASHCEPDPNRISIQRELYRS